MPTGYIYPREGRAVRDLLRKRGQLVRQRTAQILSLRNLLARDLARQDTGNQIKRWQPSNIEALPQGPEQKLALSSHLAVMHCLDEQIEILERAILKQMRLQPDFQVLRSVSGIGEVLALTIALETGDIHRFAGPGQFASYARTVDSRRESNGKKKGSGNVKC